MTTIVEPKQLIDKLWGKQRIREDYTYRLMKYVFRVDYDGEVLLLHVVTGQLVVLDPDEVYLIDKLSMPYNSKMERLVTEHYLVPEEYDEYQQVVNLRNILWKLVDAQSQKEVTSYLILPTTACNAQCWYCFEKGIEPTTMTEKTANDVVDFIVTHSGRKKVFLWWFGGEPTVAAKRIDQICRRLKEQQIDYVSDITTNGYLFDDEMIENAVKTWHLRQASISLDGTEGNFNRVKSFKNANDNPYQRMMHNVGIMLEKGISVALRMNFDQDTYQDFSELLKESRARFPEKARLMVYPHQINRDYPEEKQEAVESWFNDKCLELTEMACSAGLYRKKLRELPSLSFEMCGAVNGRWYVITPEGNLVYCCEQLGSEQVKGNIWEGITNKTMEKSWKQFSDSKRCKECVLFPRCARIKNCGGANRCYHKKETVKLTRDLIIQLFHGTS